MIRSYPVLKILNDKFFYNIKNKEIKFIFGGLFLTRDISKFRGFYSNHYLINALEIKNPPSYSRLLNILDLISRDRIIILFQKEIKIIFKDKKKLNNSSDANLNNLINDYALDGDFHLSKKINKNLINGQKKIIKVIDKVYENYQFSLKKSSSIEKKYNFSIPSSGIFDSIKEKGYVVVPNFLKKNSLNEMKNALIKIAGREMKYKQAYTYGKDNKNQRIYNLISKHNCFRDFLDCNFMYELLNKIYDRNTYHEKFGLSSIAAHIIPPGGEPLPLHIDSVVPDPIPPWMIRFIAVITLTDFTKNNGSTAVVPRSHKLLRKPLVTDKNKYKEIILTAPKGSLIMWDGLLWHRSTANTSKQDRIGVIVSYGASFFKEICGEEEHLEVIPTKIKKILSPKLRQMVGLDRGIKKGARFIA
jgi:ectoine hydroxylase-related dioxygenase (phytanoyl-CoA dioxygenase family)